MVQQPAAPEGEVQAQAAPAPPDEGVAPPKPPAPPAVNLGTDPSDAWSVRSDTIKPPAPRLPVPQPAAPLPGGRSDAW